MIVSISKIAKIDQSNLYFRYCASDSWMRQPRSYMRPGTPNSSPTGTNLSRRRPPWLVFWAMEGSRDTLSAPGASTGFVGAGATAPSSNSALSGRWSGLAPTFPQSFAS
jgi:hypothetical protein